MTNAVLVNVDYSMWSGRVKLEAQDVQGMPPKELATLGNIKIFDTDKLNLFRNHKTRVLGLVDAVGLRFMQGWLVDCARLPDLEIALGDAHSDWANDRARFIQDYPTQAAAWAKSCGKWAKLVRAKQPKPEELWSRFVFEWQTFHLTPELPHAVSKGNRTEELVNGLADKAMQSLIESLQTLYKDSFDKPNPSHKAYAALSRISAHAEALGFANPEAAALAPILSDLAERKDPALARQALAKMDSVEGVLDILSNGLPQAQDSCEVLLAQAEAMLNSSAFLDTLGLY